LAPLLPFTQSQPLRTLKSCAGSASFQSKYGCCGDGDWRKAFFYPLTVEGEMMNTLACATLQDLLIPLGFVLGIVGVIAFVLAGIGGVIAFVVIGILRSGVPR
jgi:hypothetical protein